MADIIDLDELLGPDKVVRLQGVDYRLPADIPAELYLKITSLGDQNLEDRQIIEVMGDEILKLFQIRQPDIRELPLSLRHIMELVPAIYGTKRETTDSADPPTTPRTRGASTRGVSSRPAAKKPRGTASRS